MKALQDLLLIAVGSAFVNNVVLSQFLGICPFLGVSKNVKTDRKSTRQNSSHNTTSRMPSSA